MLKRDRSRNCTKRDPLCWQSLGISWDITKEFFQMMQHAKLQYQNPFFMETFIIAAWQI